MADSRLIELFLSLVKIEALSGNEKPVADYLNLFLTSLDFQTRFDNSKIKSKSNTGNLICRIGDGGDRILLSHMDTARPTGNVKPVIDGDRIKSMGNTVLGVDNRAGNAVLLYILEKIKKEEIKTIDFTVAFTTCEETTLLGSRNLEINGRINKGFVFDSSLRPGNFINSSCGAMGFKIFVNGRASHSAIAPEDGINSILISSNAITKIRQGKIDDETTVNIGKISGGSAVNVIPEETSVEGEVRSFKVDKVNKGFNDIQKVFKDEAEKLDGKVDFQFEWDFKPYTISPDSEVFKETSSALRNIGLMPKPNSSLGGSDANSLNEIGIPSVNIGIGAQNPHSNNEFILIEDLYKSADLALELVKEK